MATQYMIDVRQYPWLKGFDTVDSDGNLPGHPDGLVTDSDIDEWLLASRYSPPAITTAPPPFKYDLFLIEQTSMEARFQLLRRGMTQRVADEGGYVRKLYVAEFVGDGCDIIESYRRRLDQIQLPDGLAGSLSETWHREAIQRERQELDELEHAFAGTQPWRDGMPPLTQGAAGMFFMFGGGLGIGLDIQGAHVFVKALLKDGPAHKAGLKAGDEIVKVGGENISPALDQRLERSEPISIRTFMLRDVDSTDPDDIQANIDFVRGALLGTPGSKAELVIKRRRGKGKKPEQKTIIVPRDFNMFAVLFSPQDTMFAASYAAEYHKPEYDTRSLLPPLPQ